MGHTMRLTPRQLSPQQLSPLQRALRIAGGVATLLVGIAAMATSVTLDPVPEPPQAVFPLRAAQQAPLMLTTVLPAQFGDEFDQIEPDWIVPPPPMLALLMPVPMARNVEFAV
jgi:hypothetical protein